ncbi:MAG: adenylate kinase [Planctomycetes bacterium]|nr:adenylate kinase [Planctomycetota bacterium]
MYLIFLGAPGAGKGTQAAKAAEKFSIPHISTGSILRHHVSEGTPLGIEAKNYMDQGLNVPDHLVTPMLLTRLEEEDARKQYILDGFPRTLPQAEALEVCMSGLPKECWFVLNFRVPDEVIVTRAAGRLLCRRCGWIAHRTNSPPKKEGVCDRCQGEMTRRLDDEEHVVRERLVVYHRETEPLIEYYQKTGRELLIDGYRDVDVIFEEWTKRVGLT